MKEEVWNCGGLIGTSYINRGKRRCRHTVLEINRKCYCVIQTTLVQNLKTGETVKRFDCIPYRSIVDVIQQKT